MAAGVSYLGMKRAGDATSLMDSNLSKTLQEAVPKLVRFVQFAVAEERIGDHKGNEFEIIMTGDDPVLNIGVRTMFDPMDKLKTTEVKFATHSFTTQEFGMAIKFNVSDIAMAEFNLETYTREVLARDVAKLRDTLVSQEMTTTPYRYIPYDHQHGVRAGLNSYYCDAARTPYLNNAPAYAGQANYAAYFTPAGGNDPCPIGGQPMPTTKAYGKIIPAQQFAWGSALLQAADETGAMTPTPETLPRAYVCEPLFIGQQVRPTADPNQGSLPTVVPGPVVRRVAGGGPTYPTELAFLGNIDPTEPTATINKVTYGYPQLNLIHVRNMATYAISLGMLPYEKMRVGSTLHEGFVLIASSVQTMNLLNAINAETQIAPVVGMGGFSPANMRDMELPQIAGASFKVPGLGVNVLVVVDDYATNMTYACYNQAFPYSDPGNLGTKNPKFYWTQQTQNITGGVLNVLNARYRRVANNLGNDWLRAGCRMMRCFGATEMSLRVTSAGSPIKMPVTNLPPQGFGPCYFFGRKAVTELVNQPWSLRTQDPDDFKRLSGYGWVMRTGYKNNWTPKNSQLTNGMPFAATRANPAYPYNVAPVDVNWTNFPTTILPYYSRNKVIKFDFPTWIDPGMQTEEDWDHPWTTPDVIPIV